MTVGVVIGRAPRLGRLWSGRASGQGTPGLIGCIKEVFWIFSRAMDAAHTYEALRPMSDAALAERGLTRADLPRAVFRKLTQED
jgi:hypothetical protein